MLLQNGVFVHLSISKNAFYLLNRLVFQPPTLVTFLHRVLKLLPTAIFNLAWQYNLFLFLLLYNIRCCTFTLKVGGESHTKVACASEYMVYILHKKNLFLKR